MNEIKKENENKKKKRPAFLSDLFDMVEICVVAAVAAILILFFIAKTGTVVGSSMLGTMHPDDIYILSDLFYTPEVGDVIVFSPGKEHDSEEKLWVKRIIATAGQTVEIKDGRVYVDGEIQEEEYLSDIAYYQSDVGRLAVYINEDKITLSVTNNSTPESLLYTLKSGDTVELYGESFNFQTADGGIYINGEFIESSLIETVPRIVDNPITVPEGYVFVMGDNRINSKDSRIIGCVDIRNIIGHVLFRFWPYNSIGPVE